MVASVTHAFVSPVPDEGITGDVGPNQWNANHVVTGEALTGVNDTNVTLALGGTPASALVNATSLTLGWSGTLAAGRLNPNVVQAVSNDVNITGSISAQVLTLQWGGTLAVARGGTGANLSATGGASQVLKQTSVGGAVTVGQLAYSDISGSPAQRTQRYVTSSPTIQSTDSILNLSLTIPTAINLPAAATRSGGPLTFKDVGAHAAANNITLTPNGVETIDGAASFVMNADRQSVTIYPFNDGTNTGWFIT